MASWACPICGEEADADELDPHGHFATDDEEEIKTDFDGDAAAAEADLQRASDAVGHAENKLAAAEAGAEAIEQEPFDGSPEAEADISQRMETVQREIETLQEELADAEDELGRTTDHWVREGYLPS